MAATTATQPYLPSLGSVCGLLLLSLWLHSPKVFANNHLDNKVYQQLIQSQQESDKQQYPAAIKRLQQLLQRSRLTPYEQATVQHQLGYLYYQNKNIRAAIRAFKQATTIGNGSQHFYQDDLYILGQLYFEQSNYTAATTHLQQWLEHTQKPTATAYALLAQAHYHNGNYRRVIRYLNKAMGMSRTPSKQWLLMLQDSYAKLGLNKERIKTIKRLIRGNPKKEYLLALSSSYGLLDKKSKQLAMLEIAYRKGYLTKSSELLTLAALMFNQNAPYKAAKVLEKGMQQGILPRNLRNLKFLANSWIRAQEFKRSIPVLEQAAKHSKGGELDVMIGNSHFQMGNWQAAAAAYQQGLQKGKLKRPENIWLLAGQSYLNAKDFSQAQAMFKRASNFANIQKKAQQWLRYTQLEQQRYRSYSRLKSSKA